LVSLLYVSARSRRRKIVDDFKRMKSVTDKLFDEMATGVAAVDGSGVISLTNRAFESLFGTKKCVGKHWDKTVREPALNFEKLASSEGTASEVQVSGHNKRGLRSLLVASSPVEGTDDSEYGVVVVVNDITRLRRFEREADRKERLSELGHLAAGVAHEIRNPLNTISIAAQRLASEFAPTDGREQYLTFTDQIRSETKRLNEIITRFLALAREDKKKQTVVQLDKLLVEVESMLRLEAQELEVALNVNSGEPVPVRADRDQLKQVFVNLFNNALEALSGTPGKIAISVRREGDNVVISFDDNGPGIAENLRDEVFTPYFTTKEAGTGLGLPTVHRIISELGGVVSIDTSKLGGAAIVMRLPVSM